MNSDKLMGTGQSQPSAETFWGELVDDESANSLSAGTVDASSAADVTSDPEIKLPAAVVYRSFVRPPMGLLTALDDSSLDGGETWRLRKTRTAIGRVTGDVVIPHDPDISAAHAEVVRREQKGGHQWHLTDLGSTNGTFVRVQQIVLRNGREVLLGSRRLTFRSPDVMVPPPSGTGTSANHRGTRPHALAPTAFEHLGPRLTEQTSPGRVAEYSLFAAGTSIGRDPGQCDVAFVDDLSMDGVHARIYQDARGRWILKDAGSLNGVWLRVSQIPLDNDAQFLLGGQRFHFRVL